MTRLYLLRYKGTVALIVITPANHYMETVFDHAPTLEEIEELGFSYSWLNIRHGLSFPYPLTEMGYRETISSPAALFDLGLLFEHRGNLANRDAYWAQVPSIASQYKLGFDYMVASLDLTAPTLGHSLADRATHDD